ncbi:hypothetical protein INR49_004388 [Caranx melampygus]|nr:hypothetical protein INR49_004388 [Caranx melampygus]
MTGFYSTSARTMAPVGTVDMMGWFSSPEVGIISLVVFLVLSATLLALCAKCNRKSTNAYQINGGKTEGAGGANGAVATKTGGMDTPDSSGSSTWKNHRNMPPSTLERSIRLNVNSNPTAT